jgi:hypothetical protein
MDDFVAFVQSDFGSDLIAAGYRRSRAVFERSANGVRVSVAFMRFRPPLRPMFNVRLQVALAEHLEDLGVLFAQDLSNVVGRGSHVEEWRWPLEDGARTGVTMEIRDALLGRGLPWLEDFLGPGRLAERLEERKDRPNMAEALSWCYEMMGNPTAALRAWEHYSTTLTISIESDHPIAVAFRKRKAELEHGAKGGRGE